MLTLTYKIAEDGSSITCTTCGLTSYHPKDVEQCYCGHCDRFHDVPDPVALVDDQFVFLDALMRGDTSIPSDMLVDPPKRTLNSLHDRRLITRVGTEIQVTVRGKRAAREHLHVQ